MTYLYLVNSALAQPHVAAGRVFYRRSFPVAGSEARDGFGDLQPPRINAQDGEIRLNTAAGLPAAARLVPHLRPSITLPATVKLQCEDAERASREIS